MNQHLYERIRNNPKFHQLVANRSRFALTLTLVVLVLYYGFMAIVAFNPTVLATSLSGGVTTIGWPIAASLMVLFWLMTGFYVWYANNKFDAINAELISEAVQGGK
jgi:uncharacterized membrane protein (DUF485 family)